ncbi:MAG: 30S ribosomal protein S8e [Candidatus Caldarchaeum sp.]|jgi:small subunit ribosomal protein S8e|uniref:Small ribosomal subunit protein eS8 n=1 Tax=Caldiarchaeum subterraneum TaxID=311458 RepID=A0A7C4DZ82_CALS0|nr:30S ribosomal protein S8e [Candidatus Caldarchaeales archaeon]
MVQWHSDLHKRKKTGAKAHPARGRRKRERGGEINLVSLGEQKVVTRRALGGNLKAAALSTKTANVVVGSVVKRLEILRVVSNPSNRDYDRRKVITKGALIETPEGLARVTSRPGQDGTVNAVLVKQGGA